MALLNKHCSSCSGQNMECLKSCHHSSTIIDVFNGSIDLFNQGVEKMYHYDSP